MKKIMFNERFGLEQAVLAGTKTQTRRMMTMTDTDREYLETAFDFDLRASVIIDDYSRYRVGETIAIAQAYKTFWRPTLPGIDWKAITDEVTHSEGWTNKMFVKAEYMPHAIRITGIKAERLQSISEADIMREGIHEGEFMNTRDKYYFDEWGDVPNHITFKTPRLAFQSLIDKVCKRGTWQRNPWVFAYEFELVR